MKRSKILLIDDDLELFDLLATYMDLAGFDLQHASDGNEGLKLQEDLSPDLILLDIIMPNLDGWSVIRQLREKSSVPIIVVSARGEEKDKLYAFRLGVDDYVVKPFSFAELVARVGAVIKRSKRVENSSPVVEREDLVIDLRRKHVFVEGEKVNLTPKEYSLLESLARYADKTIPVDRLLAEVWGPEYAGEINHVKQYIWMLRKKIENDPNTPKHLITRRGYGYRLE